MEPLETWLRTRDWAATGAGATSVFTGFTAWWVWWNRERTRLEIDATGLAPDRFSPTTAVVSFAVRNLGTRPAFGVRVMLNTRTDSKALGERLASIPAGESADFRIEYPIPMDEPYVLNEDTGEYPAVDPERVDFGDDEVEVISLRPPRLRREKSQRVRVSKLREDLRANGA